MAQSQTVGERRNTKRILLASLASTSVQFYDFYFYATATATATVLDRLNTFAEFKTVPRCERQPKGIAAA